MLHTIHPPFSTFALIQDKQNLQLIKSRFRSTNPCLFLFLVPRLQRGNTYYPCVVATYGFPRRPWEPETLDSDFEKRRPYTSLEIEILA